MTLFKHYIETSGSSDPVLSQTSEFVTYYALPYVPNPLEHKSFKHLFTREFIQSLKSKVENFVESYHFNGHNHADQVPALLT